MKPGDQLPDNDGGKIDPRGFDEGVYDVGMPPAEVRVGGRVEQNLHCGSSHSSGSTFRCRRVAASSLSASSLV